MKVKTETLIKDADGRTVEILESASEPDTICILIDNSRSKSSVLCRLTTAQASVVANELLAWKYQQEKEQEAAKALQDLADAGWPRHRIQ